MTHVIQINSNGIPTGGGPVPLVGIPAVFSFTDSGVNVDAAQLIPLNPVNNQQLVVTLSNQVCTLNVYTKEFFAPFVPSGGIPTDPPVYKKISPIFLDLFVNDSLLLGGVLCLNQNLIVRNLYLGFVGDMAFIDLNGTNDPEVSGLGSRYQLAYFANLNTR